MTSTQKPFAAKVNSNIRAEIARDDIKTAYIAEQLGLSVEVVRRRLRGELNWQLDEIETIAALVQVDPSTLTA